MSLKSCIALLVTITILLLFLQALVQAALEVSQDSLPSECSEYSRELPALLAEDELPDVTIAVGEKEFQVHKVVILVSSPYLRNKMKEATGQSSQPITLHDLDAGIFNMIKDYMYTGRITICDSNVEALLAAASHLKMEDISAYCCNHMKKNLNAPNCPRIISIADKYSCRDLYGFATAYALDFFQEVAKSEEFLRLTKNQLIEIISKNTLNAPEDTIYEAIMHWIKHKETPGADRTVHLPDMMLHVRLTQMDRNYLVKQLSKDQLISDCEKCQEYLKEAKDYLVLHCLEDGRNAGVSSLEARFKPRRTSYLFAVGGYLSDQSTSTVERYDPRKNKWTEVATMEDLSGSAGVAVLKNSLCAVGGYDGSAYLSDMECYDPHNDKWVNNKTPLEPGRKTYNCVTVLDGIFYVIGGYNSLFSSLQSVMKYDPNKKEWIECEALGKKRSQYAVGALGGYIYVLGGINVKTLDTVERYDPKKDKWSIAPHMITGRYNFGSAAHEGYLYAVGGLGDGYRLIKSAERYDSHTNKWEIFPPMIELRYGLGLVVANRLIYAVGGRDSNNNDQKTVEVYDPGTNKWSSCAPMLKKRIWFGLAAMEY